MPEYQQEVSPDDGGGGGWNYYGGGFSVGDAIAYTDNVTPTFESSLSLNLFSARLGELGNLPTFDLSWVPRDGNYGGNGPNDAWDRWQAYIDTVLRVEHPLTRGPEDQAYLEQLMRDYYDRYPNSDPYNMKPKSESDWNAFRHDISSWGGAVHHIVGNLAFAFGNLVQGLLTGHLYSLASVPFIGVLASVMHTAQGVVNAGSAVIGGISQAGSDLFGGFGGALSNLMSGNINGAINSIVTGVSHAFQALGEAIGNAFKALFPVVIDLDGDGIHLVSAADSHMTLNADGDHRYSGWVSGGDAILAYDENHNGAVDGYSEFGLSRFAPGSNSDLAGLAAFDTNGDGIFDASDDAFDDFLVWVDSNGDGIAQDGEARTLAEAGILSIDLRLNGQSSTQAGNFISNTTSVRFADGSVHDAADVAFASSSALDQARMISRAVASHDLGHGLEVVTLSDGGPAVVLQASDLNAGVEALVVVGADHGSDVTVIGSVATTFIGGQGDDHFVGTAIGSTFMGAGGVNHLDGQSGSDTYVLDVASGATDIIHDTGGVDRFLITSSGHDLRFTLQDGDLVVSDTGHDILRVIQFSDQDLNDEFVVDGVAVDLHSLFHAPGSAWDAEGVFVSGNTPHPDWMMAA